MSNAKSNPFVLEVGCEEIPARFIASMVTEIETKLCKAITNARISIGQSKTYATYRRLVIYIDAVAPMQEDLESIVKGPPMAIAYSDGKLAPAGEGFLKKNKATVSDIVSYQDNGKEYLAIKYFEKGQSVLTVLPDLIVKVLTSVKLPIAMRWGRREDTFIRPVHWVLALWGPKSVSFDLFGVQSGKVTYGHRFLSGGTSLLGKELTVTSAEKYEDILVNNGQVMVSFAERKASVLSQLPAKQRKRVDQELLQEICYLVEYPTVLKGSFDKKYLELPDVVLVECMKKHQRYFPVYNVDNLTHHFLVVADNVSAENADTIVEGNQRVLAARLEDAYFFYREDQSSALDTFVSKLDGIVFQKGMGSVLDKTNRVASIAVELSRVLQLSVKPAEWKKLSGLAKADLVTQMVFEFPALQGEMGALYGSISGEPDAICEAIKEHYMPLYSGADCPVTDMGRILALADRFDTLIASFYNGHQPSGSQDPLGLRRAVYAIVSIIYDSGWELDFQAIIEFGYALLGKPLHQERLMTFFQQRMRSFLLDHSIRYDEADSVMHLAMTSLPYAMSQATLIQQYREAHGENFKQLVETAVRVKRLAAKSSKNKVQVTLFKEPIERDAYELLENQLQTMPVSSLTPWVKLSDPLTTYFDHILVMDKDNNIRNNRLGFLRQCDDYYMTCADFEKIVLDS